MSVLTQDGPYRHFKFKLRPIRKDYWNVLCMANEATLHRTANELIKDLSLMGNDKTRIKSHKSNGFWIVYSKRFKESIHILKVETIVEVLKSFHTYNKDTGVYVVAVIELKDRIDEFSGRSLVDCLWILSTRLKKNTQKEFFKSMADHVPNVLYQLNGMDIIKVLWNLNNAGYNDAQICRSVCQKFMEYITDLNSEDLSGACLAFGRFGYRNLDLYDRIQAQVSQIDNINVLFQMTWGLCSASLDVSHIVQKNRELLCSTLDGLERWKLMIFKNVLSTVEGSEDLMVKIDDLLKEG